MGREAAVRVAEERGPSRALALMLAAGTIVAAIAIGNIADEWEVASQTPPITSPDDPTSGVVSATIDAAGPVAVGEGAVWVLEDDTVQRVDPITNAVTAPFAPLAGPPDRDLQSIAVGGGKLWVTSVVADPDFDADIEDIFMGEVIAIDVATGLASEPMSVGGLPRLLLFDGDSLWMSADSSRTGGLTRLQGEAVTTIALDRFFPRNPGHVSAMAAANGSIWVVFDASFALDWTVQRGAVVRINPETEELLAVIPVRFPTDIVFGEGALWVTGLETVRIDPATNEVVAVLDIPLGELRKRMGVGEGSVWIEGDGVVMRIDPATNTVVEVFDIGSRDVAVGEGAAWVRVEDGLVRIDP